MANLLAIAGHLGTVDDLGLVLRMATEHGARADLVRLDCTEPAAAVAAVPERLAVVKDGAVIVTNQVETAFARPAR